MIHIHFLSVKSKIEILVDGFLGEKATVSVHKTLVKAMGKYDVVVSFDSRELLQRP